MPPTSAATATATVPGSLAPRRATARPDRRVLPDQRVSRVPAPRSTTPFAAVVLADTCSELAERMHETLIAVGAVGVRFAASPADLLRSLPEPQQSGLGVLTRPPRAEAVAPLVATLRQRGWRRLVLACDGSEVLTRLAIAAKVRCLVLRADPPAAGNARRIDPDAVRTLSAREVEVLQAVADGLSNGEVGGQLGVSGLTVKSHLARIGRKTGTGDRAAMVALAMRAGILV